jgi:SPP1 family predicted phage head-tail adaptor
LPAGERTELITFQRATTADDDYGQPIETWTDLTTRRARVRFGLAQEQRQAAQESASQTATFECIRSAQLDSITNKDRIVYLGDQWDINETAPLDRNTIRFTAIRLAD